MISNAITKLESRKKVDTRELYDSQYEQLKIDLRHKLNAMFWGRPAIWIRLWSRAEMLNVTDLVGEGLKEQI